eukprot:3687557-Pleurochrysis_carterae.AAC.1
MRLLVVNAVLSLCAKWLGRFTKLGSREREMLVHRERESRQAELKKQQEVRLAVAAQSHAQKIEGPLAQQQHGA